MMVTPMIAAKSLHRKIVSLSSSLFVRCHHHHHHHLNNNGGDYNMYYGCCRRIVKTTTAVVQYSYKSSFNHFRYRGFHTSIPSFMTDLRAGQKTSGIGLHNVRERVLPSARKRFNELFQHTSDPKTVSIIGAPMTYGQPYCGTDRSPELLRSNGLRGMLSSLNWRVEDVPDLDIESAIQQYKNNNPDATKKTINGMAKNYIQVGCGCNLLAQQVYNTMQLGRFPLILGGDHSIGIGSLAGILKHNPQTGILWIDAHADINTPTISESGNMHGMPIGMMMNGLYTENIPGFEWLNSTQGSNEYPRLQPDSIVYIGLRDVDQAERALIHQLGIMAYTMTDIDHYGIGQVMDMALHHLLQNNPSRPLHISYDIDAVDPILAPATGTAVRGGLTFREAHLVAEVVTNSGNLASAEIVELNPTLSPGGGDNDTIELGLHLLTSFMGKSII